MTQVELAHPIMDRLRERHPRFHANAYLFVLCTLQRVLADLGERRHISGGELAGGARSLALERFGPMARTVLEHWGIHSTGALGRVVFALVECGILDKQEEDSPEDFEGLSDFEEAFDRDYPWAAHL